MITKDKQVKRADHSSAIGEAGNNHMASRNGMDEIDLWAERIGGAERSKSAMTPQRRHISTL